MSAQLSAINPEEDLEALFDSIAERRAQELQQVVEPGRLADNAGQVAPYFSPEAAAVPDSDDPTDVHRRLGNLTRQLHDTLGALGYDKTVTKLAQGLPDARERLNYIARLTGQAAEKALNCVDRGQALQAEVGASAGALAAEWERVFAQQISVDDFRAIARRTREFLTLVPKRTGELGAVFTDIMMAQDFHDLTGQVIRKVVDLAEYTEKQLVDLLLETTPPELRVGMEHHLTGPATNPHGRQGVVSSQEQVDELLDRLGF